jgi:hypothetical protein
VVLGICNFAGCLTFDDDYYDVTLDMMSVEFWGFL